MSDVEWKCSYCGQWVDGGYPSHIHAAPALIDNAARSLVVTPRSADDETRPKPQRE